MQNIAMKKLSIISKIVFGTLGSTSLLLGLPSSSYAATYASPPEGFQAVNTVVVQDESQDVDFPGVRWNFFDEQVSGELSTVIKTRFTYTEYIRGRSMAANEANQTDFDVTQGGVIASGTVLDRKFSYFLSGDFVYDNKNAATDLKGTDFVADARADSSFVTKTLPAKLASLEDAYITYRSCQWAYTRDDATILKSITTPLEAGVHFPEQ